MHGVKTSLLDALTLSLGIETYQYAFTAEDFHRLPNEPENSKKPTNYSNFY